MRVAEKMGATSLRVSDDGQPEPPIQDRGFQLWGWNLFYDGYLAFLLGRPKPEDDDHGAADGWQMAQETVGVSNKPSEWSMVDQIRVQGGTQLWTALAMEIEKGHILVLPNDPVAAMALGKLNHTPTSGEQTQ